MGIRVALTVMHLLPLQKPAVCNNLCSADFILDRNVWGGKKKKKKSSFWIAFHIRDIMALTAVLFVLAVIIKIAVSLIAHGLHGYFLRRWRLIYTSVIFVIIEKYKRNDDLNLMFRKMRLPHMNERRIWVEGVMTVTTCKTDIIHLMCQQR